MTNSTTILLVEDDRHIALAFQIRLRAGGFKVRLAATVAEAIEAAECAMPDVALLDINLPDGDGIELMQHLLSLEEGSNIRCIIMTASRKPGLREYALAMGARAFLEKPFSSGALIEIIENDGFSTKAS